MSTSLGESGHGSGGRGVVGPIGLLFRRLRTRAWRLKYLLVFLTLACLLLGLGAAHLQGPRYSATARIEIDTPGIAAQDRRAPSEAELAREHQFFETQYELLRSGFIAIRVAEMENVAADSVFRRALDIESSDSSPRLVMSRIAATITIEPVPGSNLVDIVATTSAPQVSARIANSWAEQFLEANLEKRFGDDRETRDRTASQLEAQRVELEASEARLTEFARENSIVVLETLAADAAVQQVGAENLSTSQLSALNDALIAAVLRRVEAHSALDARPSGSRIDRLAALRSRRAEAVTQLADLRRTLGDANPRLQALEAEIEALDRAIESDDGGVDIGSDLQVTYEDALRQENQLREQLDALRDNMVDQQGVDAEYRILRREVLTNRELYEALLQRQVEVRASGAGMNNMRLVTSAIPPSAPTGLTPQRAGALALAVAILVSLAVLGLGERLDRCLRNAQQVQRHLGLAVLGEIPFDDTGDPLPELRVPQRHLAMAYARAQEQILSALAGHVRRVVLLTSTSPGEGKSVSALGLSLASRATGGRAVVLDLDLRNQGLSRLLGIPASTMGMGEFIVGRTTRPEIVHMPDHGIDFIPAGSVPQETAGLTADGGLSKLIADLARHYDLVVIDGPSVLDQPEVEEIAYLSDAVLFVVRAVETSAYTARDALAVLDQPGANLLGALVTMVKD